MGQAPMPSSVIQWIHTTHKLVVTSPQLHHEHCKNVHAPIEYSCQVAGKVCVRLKEQLTYIALSALTLIILMMVVHVARLLQLQLLLDPCLKLQYVFCMAPPSNYISIFVYEEFLIVP